MSFKMGIQEYFQFLVRLGMASQYLNIFYYPALRTVILIKQAFLGPKAITTAINVSLLGESSSKEKDFPLNFSHQLQ